MNDDIVEKLAEKHQQTQTAIKNLQNIEEKLFNNLEEAKKKKMVPERKIYWNIFQN